MRKTPYYKRVVKVKRLKTTSSNVFLCSFYFVVFLGEFLQLLLSSTCFSVPFSFCMFNLFIKSLDRKYHFWQENHIFIFGRCLYKAIFSWRSCLDTNCTRKCLTDAIFALILFKPQLLSETIQLTEDLFRRRSFVRTNTFGAGF